MAIRSRVSEPGLIRPDGRDGDVGRPAIDRRALAAIYLGAGADVSAGAAAMLSFAFM
jgi:hypothetical protein